MESREIAAGEFKAHCLKLLDEVHESGREYIVTKRGRPVARLVPLAPEKKKKRKSILGCMKGTIHIHGDIIGPFHDVWEGHD